MHRFFSHSPFLPSFRTQATHLIMPDRYCIASGNYTSAAIWSATDGGAGGASAPMALDNRFFHTSVTVANFTNLPALNSTTIVRAGTTLTVNAFRGLFPLDSHWELGGTCHVLLTALNKLGFINNATMHILQSGLLNLENTITTNFDFLFGDSGKLTNEGVILCNDHTFVTFSGTNSAIKQQPGTIQGTVKLLPNVASVGETFFVIDDTKEAVFQHFLYEGFVGGSQYTWRFHSPVQLENVTFINPSGAGNFQIEQFAQLKITGSVSSAVSETNMAWSNTAQHPSVFFGTENQTIHLPATISQNWTADKTAGTLTLENFDGGLQGRTQTLIIASTSRIDMAGSSPVLTNAAQEQAAYPGIMADAMSFTGDWSQYHLADYEREALLRCENEGTIQIPAGKVLIANQFQNKLGGKITGTGTLCVRRNQLTNAGQMDSTILVRYFDCPIAAVLNCPEKTDSGVTFTVDYSQSIGTNFQINWGDGTFSDTNQPGTLNHIFAFAENARNLTVTLTVTNEDNTVLTASKTVLVSPQPLDLELSLDKTDGYPPLSVTANLLSEYGVSFRYDWGNGHVTEETTSREATHTYAFAGEFVVTVTAKNAEGRILSQSALVQVTPIPLPPIARLAITPWEGEVPHEVTVSTLGTVGTKMQLDWGDGTETLGPMNSVHGTMHRYENSGRYLVTFRVWNELDIWTETSQVVSVLDPKEVQAQLVIKPSSGTTPLTVLADATGSYGESYRFHWGDGSPDTAFDGGLDGIPSLLQSTHTFDRAGYYSVIFTATKEGKTASATSGVVVLLSPLFPPTSILPSPLGPVELDSQGKPAGIPRGNQPGFYRITLAQGKSYMSDTLQLFCTMTENGRALENGSALFLGRITLATGQPISPSEIATAEYTIYRLDNSDAAIRVPVEGHERVPLNISEIVTSDFVLDENWPFDEIGYNFRYILSDQTASPFPIAGRNYLVAFTLTLQGSTPKILLQYRVCVV